jgi:hypothetical protein
MKELDVPKSGKRGAVVAYRTTYGQISRQYVVPHDPCTAIQVERRAAFSRARFLWGTLREAQRVAWAGTASGRRTRARLQQSGRLSGYLLFIQINCNLAAIGLPMVLDPPPAPQFPDNPVGQLHITNTSGSVTLELAVSGAPTQFTIVSGSRPCSPGTTYVDHFPILGLLPNPEQGISNITDLYAAKWLLPPAGSRVFIRTMQQINGWEDRPTQTSAFVPPPSP